MFISCIIIYILKTYFTDGLSGAANVILVVSTRRGLLPQDGRAPSVVELAPGEQPFGMEMNHNWADAERPIDDIVPQQENHDGAFGNLLDRHGLNGPGRREMNAL